MKIVISLLGVALLISSGIMFSLVKKGAALRPAGVIAPAEFSAKPELIGQAIALRLFPDFQTTKNVIWYLADQEVILSHIPVSTLNHYQTNSKPVLIDFRTNPQFTCTENCWYVQAANTALPEVLQQKLKEEPVVEIFVQYFNRNEEVSAVCENEKILEAKCIGPVSLREVKKKLKNPGPYFFMRRYMDSQFYLFVEKIE